MKKFMDADFLLETDTARELFHGTAERSPIIDYHNHLSPRDIYDDRVFTDISDIWLGGDHYKWRAMRWNGVPERLITGDAEPYEKFLAWADTVQNLIGNPLYHWTHLELQRYFGIDDPLTPDTAATIYALCNEKLGTPEYSVRNLLRMQRVEALCTTDDPADTLEWHRKIREDGFEISVLPSFRPEKAIGIEKDGFAEYLERLFAAAGREMPSSETIGVGDILSVLIDRLDFFIECGCRVSDHSIENTFYIPATEADVDAILKKRLAGEVLSESDLGKYHGYMLRELGCAYAKRDIVMQLHIGALRNASTRMYKAIGADCGGDCIGDMNYAPQLAGLLDACETAGGLPKTILYCLNPNDTEMLAAMAGSFVGNDDGIRGRVQLGAAWWFCDHRNGMERQLDALSDMGLLSAFVGMLTDSRSFLSFPRHEYFRRILCNKIGGWVETGEYPRDREYLERLVRGICSENAREYFNM